MSKYDAMTRIAGRVVDFDTNSFALEGNAGRRFTMLGKLTARVKDGDDVVLVLHRTSSRKDVVVYVQNDTTPELSNFASINHWPMENTPEYNWTLAAILVACYAPLAMMLLTSPEGGGKDSIWFLPAMIGAVLSGIGLMATGIIHRKGMTERFRARFDLRRDHIPAIMTLKEYGEYAKIHGHPKSSKRT